MVLYLTIAFIHSESEDNDDEDSMKKFLHRLYLVSKAEMTKMRKQQVTN